MEETELFIEDRREHVWGVIKPMLDSGGVVVLDRYYWSTAAYQGARGLDPDQLLTVNETFAPLPDLVILLDAPAEVGLARIQDRGDRPDAFEKQSTLARVRENYQHIATRLRPGVAVVLDATRPSRETVSAALLALERTVAKKISSDRSRTHRLTINARKITQITVSIRQSSLMVSGPSKPKVLARTATKHEGKTKASVASKRRNKI